MFFGDYLKKDETELERRLAHFNKKCKCPNCNNEPDEQKTRKFKCKNCQQYVFVKKNNDNFYYLTEQQSEEMEYIKKFVSFKYKNFNKLVNCGYDKEILLEEFNNSYIVTFEPLKEFIWSKFNFLLESPTTKPHQFSLIYHSMANFSKEEGNHEQVIKFRKLALDSQLNENRRFLNYQYSEVECVILSVSGTECEKYDNTVIELEKLFENPPLPHKTIEFDSCRCRYGFRPKKDRKGDWLLKL